MKKILIAFIASVALVLGSGAALSGASAAYPSTVPVQTPSVPTKTVAEGAKFKVTIKIKAGNSKVNGTLTVKFNGKTYKVKVKNGVAQFKGKAPKVNGTKTKAIKYTFKPNKGSVFKSKKGSAKIKIKG